jgi:hypothetical protein
MKHISILRSTLLLLPVIFLYSCSMQVKSSYILNPDMSGKCIIEEKMGMDVAEIMAVVGNQDPKKLYMGLDGFANDTVKKTPHDILIGFASKILASKGIEAWKDIQFGMIGKDTVYFKGTAYFKDISNISISAMDTLMEVTQNANGETIIRVRQKPKDAVSDSSMQATLAAEKKYLPSGGIWSAMMHYYMSALLRGIDVKLSYQVPGRITDYSSFVKKNDNTVQLDMNDTKIINALDTLMNSNYLAFSALSKSSSPNAYNSYLYGQNKPLQVTFKSDAKPLFDYAKEVAEAKKYYTAFRRTSGIEKYDSVQLVIQRQKEEEALKEHGTLVLTAADSADHKVYFKTLGATQYYGMLSFSGDLSRPMQTGYYSKIQITKAVDDKGNNVLDSIQNHDNISAYLSPETYSYTDSVQLNNKVTFSLSPNLPEDCKIINLEGVLVVDDNTSVPFKIIKLYLKPRDKSYNNYGGEKY